jgi:DNA-binding beta-propeller fold protein YncE
MKCRFLSILISVIFIFSAAVVCYAEVEWEVANTLNIEGKPLDMVISPDAKYIYVLTKGGNILIYLTSGKLVDTIEVGQNLNRINLGPKGQYLFVSSPKNKTVKIIKLSFIHEIIALGSPRKGNKDAPVVISVFSDFQ